LRKDAGFEGGDVGGDVGEFRHLLQFATERFATQRWS